MTAELRKSIESLRKLSPQLNKATDDANRVVGMVEKFLNEECSIGVSVRVNAGTDENGAGKWLGYDRCNGKFRIVVIEQSYRENEDGSREIDTHGHPVLDDEVNAWSDCPRGDKLRTFQKLPHLLVDLAKVVTETIAEVEKTTAAVEQIKDAFDATPALPSHATVARFQDLQAAIRGRDIPPKK